MMKTVTTPVRMLIAAALLISIGIVACPQRPPPVSPALLGRALLDEPEVRQGYSILVEGTDEVGGKQCLTVRLKPPQKHMPWRQLWLDKQTLKPVAARSWSADDKAIGSSVFAGP